MPYVTTTPPIDPSDYDLPLAGEFRLHFAFNHEGEIGPDIEALSGGHQPLPSTTEFLLRYFEPVVHQLCREHRNELREIWTQEAIDAQDTGSQTQP